MNHNLVIVKLNVSSLKRSKIYPRMQDFSSLVPFISIAMIKVQFIPLLIFLKRFCKILHCKVTSTSFRLKCEVGKSHRSLQIFVHRFLS